MSTAGEVVDFRFKGLSWVVIRFREGERGRFW
jgi:hypothetical protein